MSEYKVLLTQIGLEKLEEAMATGTSLVIKEMGFGDAFGEPYVPTIQQTDLKHKIFAKTLDEAILTEGTIRYRPSSMKSPEGSVDNNVDLYLIVPSVRIASSKVLAKILCLRSVC